jgi:hypothetical protein
MRWTSWPVRCEAWVSAARALPISAKHSSGDAWNNSIRELITYPTIGGVGADKKINAVLGDLLAGRKSHSAWRIQKLGTHRLGTNPAQACTPGLRHYGSVPVGVEAGLELRFYAFPARQSFAGLV